SGRPFFDMWPKTRRTAGRCPKAPRACNWSRPHCRAGRSGAGSTCPRSRCEATIRKGAMKINLPRADGTLASYTLRGPGAFRPASAGARFSRIAYSAAHVVANARAAGDPWLDCAIDWDTTIAYRRRLWGMGLGVAEAMDTAQRGMGLDWPTSLELIRRSLDAARDVPGARVASGCGTDQLAPDAAQGVDDVVRAYEEQMAAIEKLGGRLIVMASRALARVAKSPADY